MKIALKKSIQPQGSGKKLYLVLWIMVGMPENSYLEYWLANDDNSLKKIIEDKLRQGYNEGSWVAQDYLGYKTFEENFEADWETHIKLIEIGNIFK